MFCMSQMRDFSNFLGDTAQQMLHFATSVGLSRSKPSPKDISCQQSPRIRCILEFVSS